MTSLKEGIDFKHLNSTFPTEQQNPNKITNNDGAEQQIPNIITNNDGKNQVNLNEKQNEPIVPETIVIKNIDKNQQEINQKIPIEHKSFYKSSGLPKELTDKFQPLVCLLCDVHVTSPLTAKAHYVGKPHHKNIKSFLNLWCIKTGNPMPKLPNVERPAIDVEKSRCSLCDVTFTSAVDREIHFSGKNHLKRLYNPITPAKRQKIDVSYDPSGRFGIGSNFVSDSSVDDQNQIVVPKLKPKFYCDLCNVQAVDENQLQQHMKGVKHFKALRTKTPASVIPAPVNPADSILTSVCKTDEACKPKIDASMHRTPTGHYYCQVCNMTMNSEDQFVQHSESKKHKTKLSLKKIKSSNDLKRVWAISE
uniref:C2H2-type domain-containing protein n=1 Tax=Clastoptera arizonana TaxID=38151 RepID=A0A1B6DTM1_9HEMI